MDAMCVLKTSQHKEEAEAWINFMASTEANLRNMDYIWYASPNAEALETILPTMRRPTESPWIPLSMRSWPPPRRSLDRCEALLGPPC